MKIFSHSIKKIPIICFLWGFLIPFTYSQNGKFTDGGHFEKRIEYNFVGVQLIKEEGGKLIILGYKCNLAGKKNVEKLFFGDFNAPVEFLYAPSFEASTKGEAGFRIVRDSLDKSYILEVKHIPNYEEVYRKLSTPTYYQLSQLTGIPEHLIDSVPFEARGILLDYFGAKQRKDMLQLFKVETRSFPVSNQFAEIWYKKMVLLINNFKGKGVPPIIADGYSVTFRCVVDDEVWSLNIHEPRRNALKLSDLCRQIITDADSNKLDESMYISVLDGLDF